MLTEYVASLDAAIVRLCGMCEQLLHDEDSYREIPPGEQSAFNRDNTAYDGMLLQLDQLGRRLNKLFSRL